MRRVGHLKYAHHDRLRETVRNLVHSVKAHLETIVDESMYDGNPATTDAYNVVVARIDRLFCVLRTHAEIISDLRDIARKDAPNDEESGGQESERDSGDGSGKSD